jgi:ech hydrogenase subunit A
MYAISALVLFPLISAILVAVVRNHTVRDMIVRICAVVTAGLTLAVVFLYFNQGISFQYDQKEMIDYIITLMEIIIAIFIITVGIKNKKYIAVLFSVIQTPLILWLNLRRRSPLRYRPVSYL